MYSRNLICSCYVNIKSHSDFNAHVFNSLALIAFSLPQRLTSQNKLTRRPPSHRKFNLNYQPAKPFNFISNMSIFYHEEAPNSSKGCKFLASALKDAFSSCHNFGEQLSNSSPEEDYPDSDSEDEQEVITNYKVSA